MQTVRRAITRASSSATTQVISPITLTSCDFATKKSVKVVLTEDVRALGLKGDVVDVKPGHARNHLVPQNLALYALPKNVDAVQSMLADRAKAPVVEAKKDGEEQDEDNAPTGAPIFDSMRQLIRSWNWTFPRTMGQDDIATTGVTTRDIFTRLRQARLHHIREMDIRLPHGSQSITDRGEFEWQLYLTAPDRQAPIRVKGMLESIERVFPRRDQNKAAKKQAVKGKSKRK